MYQGNEGSGKDWEVITQIAILLRCLDGKFRKHGHALLGLCGRKFQNIYAHMIRGATVLAARAEWKALRTQHPKAYLYPHVALLTPTNSSFCEFDAVLIHCEDATTTWVVSSSLSHSSPGVVCTFLPSGSCSTERCAILHNQGGSLCRRVLSWGNWLRGGCNRGHLRSLVTRTSWEGMSRKKFSPRMSTSVFGCGANPSCHLHKRPHGLETRNCNRPALLNNGYKLAATSAGVPRLERDHRLSGPFAGGELPWCLAPRLQVNPGRFAKQLLETLLLPDGS